MTLCCPQCHTTISGATKATCPMHGPMVPGRATASVPTKVTIIDARGDRTGP